MSLVARAPPYLSFTCVCIDKLTIFWYCEILKMRVHEWWKSNAFCISHFTCTHQLMSEDTINHYLCHARNRRLYHREHDFCQKLLIGPPRFLLRTLLHMMFIPHLFKISNRPLMWAILDFHSGVYQRRWTETTCWYITYVFPKQFNMCWKILWLDYGCKVQAMAIDIEMLQQELDASIHQHQAKVGMVSKAEKVSSPLNDWMTSHYVYTQVISWVDW